MLTAFADESGRTSPEGFYVVACAVVTADLDLARRRARSVLLRGQRRYHWRNEDEGQHHRMLDCMAALELAVAGYACRPIGRRTERARALCLKRLLWDLRCDGVEKVVIESRYEGDKHDRLTIVRAQQAGEASSDLDYAHQSPLASRRTAAVVRRCRR